MPLLAQVGLRDKLGCNRSCNSFRWMRLVTDGQMANIKVLIYINDLANTSPALYFILFADDTNVSFFHVSWRELV